MLMWLSFLVPPAPLSLCRYSSCSFHPTNFSVLFIAFWFFCILCKTHVDSSLLKQKTAVFVTTLISGQLDSACEEAPFSPKDVHRQDFFACENVCSSITSQLTGAQTPCSCMTSQTHFISSASLASCTPFLFYTYTGMGTDSFEFLLFLFFISAYFPPWAPYSKDSPRAEPSSASCWSH